LEVIRMTKAPLLGRLAGGEAVIDRFNSHLHPGVVEILPEALARVNAEGKKFLVEEVDFGRPIGQTICVETGPLDQVVFAQRPKRAGLSRFVSNREPEKSSSVTVILKAGDRGEYVLITAFVGAPAPPEPWDRNATEQSVPFWSSHALCWGAEETIPGTETDQCPW
jgi:hypothetical protein